MKVLLTGGTGFIGSAALAALTAAGHEVTAVVRSHASAAAVEAGGAASLIGDITDSRWLAEHLRDADGAVHLAAGDEGAAMDDAVIDAVIDAFGGSAKPYVHTGGVWVWGSGSAITEESPLAPPAITAWRVEREARLLSSDVKASVIAPGIVYRGLEGIAGMVAAGPRDESGALVLIGSGEQHWASVHVDDLAALYLAALEIAPGGRTYLGVSGVNPTVRDIGEALSDAVVPGSDDEARARLGEGFAEALLLDQQASGDRARAELGWLPTRPALVEEARRAHRSAAS